MFDRTRRYFKILNKEECHNGFQYKTGLNVDTIPFNDNLENSCCEGGLYFAPVESIFAFTDIGPWCREVILPEDAKVIKDPSDPEKYRADKIVLGERFKWRSKEGIERLIKASADIHAYNDAILRCASEFNHILVVKLLLENGADIHAENNEALRSASYYGYTKIVKLLLENHANIHARNDEALRWASYCGRPQTVRLLLENGADPHANNDEALRLASYKEHTKTIEILKQYM